MSVSPQPTGDKPVALVVEDDPDMQFLVKLTLQSHGFDVRAFDSAEDAVPHLREAQMLLFDVRLPGMSGLELLDMHVTTEMAPVVMMSAHADRKIAEQALALGAVDFVPKPFDPNGLAATLLSHLHQAA